MAFDRNTVAPNGKTYAQIEAELAAYVQLANTALASVVSKHARWSSYSGSHSTFEVLVGDPYAADNVVLSLPACTSVAGPVQWQPQRIEVIWHSAGEGDNRDSEYEIRDERVGFRAVGLMFRWRRGYDLWAQGGLWFGRGNGPALPLSYEEAKVALTRILGHFYNGMIGYNDMSSEVLRIIEQLPVLSASAGVPNESSSE